MSYALEVQISIWHRNKNIHSLFHFRRKSPQAADVMQHFLKT